MKKMLLTACGLLLGISLQAQTSSGLNIIPIPSVCQPRTGTFEFNAQTKIILPANNKTLAEAVETFTERIQTATGFSLPIATKGGSTNAIVCKVNPKLSGDEAYTLDITPKTIRIECRAANGLFYALQTVRQLLPPSIESNQPVDGIRWTLPCASIKDQPSLGYRGMMLDVVRHFQDKEFVKRHIDRMAFHKLNTFHWHLTDDQGWRIEIKKYPKLTTIGSWRKLERVGHHKDDKNKTWKVGNFGGFYTQEEIKEVIEYARKRYITIIPEIEMPGHAVAALAAYPEYSCSGGPFDVTGEWGILKDVFCTREQTFTFLQDILDEVCALFPSEIIHIGGDEVPKTRWERCKACQDRMAQEGIKNETDLQGYFVSRIEKYLRAKGKRALAWDENVESDTTPQSLMIMSWRGEKGGIEAVKRGHQAIMVPNQVLYFDYYQGPKDKEPLSIGGMVTLEKVYNHSAVPQNLTPEQRQLVKGIQANLWAEYIATIAHSEYMTFPRIAALAEIAWSADQPKDFQAFKQRLSEIIKHYDVMGINYRKLD